MVELEVHQLSPFRLERYPLDILDSKTSMYITAPSIINNPASLSTFAFACAFDSSAFSQQPRELDVERSRRAVLHLLRGSAHRSLIYTLFWIHFFFCSARAHLRAPLSTPPSNQIVEDLQSRASHTCALAGSKKTFPVVSAVFCNGE